MSNIYFVYLIDKYCDEHSINIIAIYRDQEQAVAYAQTCDIEHDEIIYVEERCEGVQDRYNSTIYERCHYDHTEALFSMVFTNVENMVQEEFVAVYVRQIAPMITEQVDFNRLYALYKEQYSYDED